MKALLLTIVLTCFIDAQEQSPKPEELFKQIQDKFTPSPTRKQSLSVDNFKVTHRAKKDYSEKGYEKTPPSSREPSPEDPETVQESPPLNSSSPRIIIQSTICSKRRESSPNIQQKNSPNITGSPLKKSPNSSHFSPTPQFENLGSKYKKTPLPTSPKIEK